ncbi:MAG: sugar nucleotidyltransferase [Lachnospiraceae bacterium]|nr:sugar nucleotidyltransferase [Massilistercora timonensis]
MLGIILAGGEGKRCYPITLATSKHLLPLYDKPIIYYSLSLLIESNIKDIIIITTPRDVRNFKKLLGNGSRFGIKLRYIVQDIPLGTAHAVMLVKELIGLEGCVLVYGDNYIDSCVVKNYLKENQHISGATIFAYKVSNPENYGVIELSSEGKVISIEEKPKVPKSDYAMIGLLCLDQSVFDKIEKISLSERREYEITDVLKIYLNIGKLTVVRLEESAVWSDLGNPQNLTEISYKIMLDERKTGKKVGCLEEIALDKGLITTTELFSNIKRYTNSSYGAYLMKVIETMKGEK